MSNILFLLLVGSTIVIEGLDVLDLKIDKLDSFPYPTNKSFSINIVRSGIKGPISSSLLDTLLIVIRNDNDEELDRAIIDYGFKDTIDQPYKSEYMTIPTWTKNEDFTALNITILFFRQAYNKWLEVFQLPATTMTERRQMLSTLSDTRRLLRERLNLFVPPQIQLSVFSPDERMDELMPREMATATCRATDGIPLSAPIFSNKDEIDVKTESLDEKRNERTVKFLVSLADHERRLRCVSGSTEASRVIFVMHHPTTISLDPEPGKVLKNGSTIVCVKADGYPPPVLQWVFVSGPKNASRFFTIMNGGTMFQLSKDAPFHSRWSINCSATNIIRKSVVIYNRTVTFIVGRSQEGLIVTFYLTIQIIIGVVVVVAIVLFSAMIVIIVCIIRRCCLSRESPRPPSHNNGVSGKSLSKDKDQSPDHVIPLLQGDAPPSYTESMPCQSPPTIAPESEDKVGVPSVPPDRDETQIVPTEITYAEINTSHLPMRTEPPPTTTSTTTECSSPEDDQVIYSQIVGTLSPSYSDHTNV